MAEHWRVGRHVPHHVYRSDGNTVADEVAVTHRPEDAAQIVEEHNRVERLEAALARIITDAVLCDSGANVRVARHLLDEARQTLAKVPDAD